MYCHTVVAPPEGNVAVPFDSPRDYGRALTRIRQLWKQGAVLYTGHAVRRMRRRQIDATDIQHIIRYGRITGHNKPKEDWLYTVEGTTVDQERAACLVAITGRLIIVTVLGEEQLS